MKLTFCNGRLSTKIYDNIPKNCLGIAKNVCYALLCYAMYAMLSRYALLFGGQFRKENSKFSASTRSRSCYSVVCIQQKPFAMALPANAEESGIGEGSHLENEKGSSSTEAVCNWQEKLRGWTNKYVGHDELHAILKFPAGHGI